MFCHVFCFIEFNLVFCVVGEHVSPSKIKKESWQPVLVSKNVGCAMSFGHEFAHRPCQNQAVGFPARLGRSPVHRTRRALAGGPETKNRFAPWRSSVGGR